MNRIDLPRLLLYRPLETFDICSQVSKAGDFMDQHTLFQCPLCNNALTREEKHYRCDLGHTYDIGRQGHVNLLLPQHTGRGNPGDSREMLQSRQDILNKGYYQRFSDQLNQIVLRELPADRPVTLLDAGCGEGYYTWRLKQAFSQQSRRVECYGLDVSKKAVQYAAGRDKEIFFAVASTYHLPIQDKSMDCITCIFAPRDEGEFARVLEEGGKLIVAAPGPRHLFGLREILYQEPQGIGQRGDVSGEFVLQDQVQVAYTIVLTEPRDILNLLTMTPYSKHTDEVALAKLKGMSRLKTEIDIGLKIYVKI